MCLAKSAKEKIPRCIGSNVFGVAGNKETNKLSLLATTSQPVLVPLATMAPFSEPPGNVCSSLLLFATFPTPLVRASIRHAKVHWHGGGRRQQSQLIRIFQQ